MSSSAPFPDVSVVIPFHGDRTDLHRAIESVLPQDCPHMEIIVVDDHSDGTGDMSGYDPAIVRVVRHAQNRGPAAARNTGMASARGGFLTFLDADDIMLPKTLGRRLAAARALHRDGANALAISSSGFEDADTDGTVLRQRFPRAASTASQFASGCWFNPGSCILIKHPDFVRAVGEQDARLRRLEDYDWFLRAGLQGATLLPDGSVAARIHRSKSRSKQSIEEAVERFSAKWTGKLDGHIARRVEAYLDVERAKVALDSRHVRKAAFAFMRSFARRPRARVSLSPGWTYREPE